MATKIYNFIFTALLLILGIIALTNFHSYMDQYELPGLGRALDYQQHIVDKKKKEQQEEQQVVVVECVVQEEAEEEEDEEPKKETEVLENEEVLDEDEEEDLEECKKINPIHYHNCDHY